MKSSVVLISVQTLWAAYLTGCLAHWHMARQFVDTGTCDAEKNEAWSYRGENGPENWKVKYPVCGEGRQQSPINIQTRDVEFDSNLEKLNLKYYDYPLKSATIDNNGHTIHIEPTDDVARSIRIEEKEYTLSQFHFHWGDVSYRGSEHTFNKNQYANELHFVHVSEDESIAVVGVILKEVEANNTEMDPLIQSLKKVEFKGDETELESPLSLECLIPENPISYYRYGGSLTTPACNEKVIWSVARRPIPIGKLQMKEFRNLKTVTKEDFESNESNNKNCFLVNNYRPVQPLNGRTVYTSV